MRTLHPVILCGGSGTRLWPSSRKAYPKQFIPFLGERSLYQGTLKRFSAEGFTAPLIMTSEDFRFLAIEQASAIGLSDARMIVEPVARDTAPAILAAALMLEETPNDLMIVAPSDHVIADIGTFHAAIRKAAVSVEDGTLMAFGVAPDRPETGYGYLQTEEASDGIVRVTEFTEKPNAETARRFLRSGQHLWNAGIYMGRVRDFITAFENHAPDLLEPVRSAVAGARCDLGFTRLDATAFAAARPISLDYAVMERAEHVCAVLLNCGWSDLGAWTALWEASERDERDNAAYGDVITLDCEKSYFRSEEPSMLLVGVGLKNVVAVAMRDAVLVADKSRAHDAKAVVETLRRAGKAQADDYPRFHRPWGWYETLCIDHRFQVKRIMVKPGAALSLQSHLHRSEHWVVVAGTAEVTVGDEIRSVTENESVYVPLGVKHRLANRGKVPMFLIEVQSGAYLGEDDIVRHEDVYNRS